MTATPEPAELRVRKALAKKAVLDSIQREAHCFEGCFDSFINALERCTNLDVDGDGDTGIPGHEDAEKPTAVQRSPLVPPVLERAIRILNTVQASRGALSSNDRCKLTTTGAAAESGATTRRPLHLDELGTAVSLPRGVPQSVVTTLRAVAKKVDVLALRALMNKDGPDADSTAQEAITALDAPIDDHGKPTHSTGRRRDGRTPLALCCCEGLAEVAALLLFAGADPDAVVRGTGATPLFLACEHGRAECVGLLLLAGADSTIARQDGYTALEAAELSGHKVCACLVQEAHLIDLYPAFIDAAAARARRAAAMKGQVVVSWRGRNIGAGRNTLSGLMRETEDAAPTAQQRAQAETGCRFCWLLADKLREHYCGDEPRTLLSLQEIQSTHPDWLVKQRIDLWAVRDKRYAHEYLAVSHRWTALAHPDPEGETLAALLDFLSLHKRIRYVWIDYACYDYAAFGSYDFGDEGLELLAAQGTSVADVHAVVSPKIGRQERLSIHPAAPPPTQRQRWFEHCAMREQIGLLYLSCTVLCVLEPKYFCRFWTMWEIWLAHQEASATGLVPADPEASRAHVVCLRGTPRTIAAPMTLDNWAMSSAEEVTWTLRQTRYAVTRPPDKAFQLPKVLLLDQMVRELVDSVE